MIPTYDLKAMRIKLIEVLSANLKKESKFYKEDYENIVKAVNRKTAKELKEALARHNSINNIPASEIHKHCQF